MANPRLLAIDPSLTATGWCVVELGAEPALLAAGVIETKPTPKAKRHGATQCEDDMRRAAYVYGQLSRVERRHTPAIVAVEAAAGSKSAKAAKALGIAQAAVACFVYECFGGRAVYVTTHAAGEACGLAPTQRVAGGRTAEESDAARKARKAAIAEAVIARYGLGAWADALGAHHDFDGALLPRYEGAHDAAAVALAAWQRPEVAAVRAMRAELETDRVMHGEVVHLDEAAAARLDELIETTRPSAALRAVLDGGEQ